MKTFYSKISLILLISFIITLTQNFTNAFALDSQEGIAPIYATDSQSENISPSTHNQIVDNQSSQNLAGSSSNANLQTGWVLKNNVWYFMTNGKAKSGWVYYNDNWYFCDKNGMMKTGWILDNNTWYFLEADGIMKTGWVKLDGWYFLDSSGAMKTGWIFDDKWYFLLSSGKMHTGWHLENDNWYYLNSNGDMAQGWVFDTYWYYMDIDGTMITDLCKIDGVWYFFESNGKWSEDKTMSDEGGSFIDKDGKTVSYKKSLTGSCTAYTAPPGAITSIGLVPKVGYVAVNPRIIPYGTKMYICSKDGSITYGYAVAADTGGAMLSGKRLLDLYYNTEYECIQFGVQNMNVYILD